MQLSSSSLFLVAVLCMLGCAGRSEGTPPGSGGGSSLAGHGGTGLGGASAGQGGSGAAGAPAHAVLPTCLQPPEPGTCRGYLERFAFNGSTLSCEPFVYGGCGGNGNNFETAAECEATCVSQYSHCDPISREKGCPCDDARDCSYGVCSNAIYELTLNGQPECPPSPIGVCAGSGAESCDCPIAGGDSFCRP